jgi:hypothetical protein
MNAHRGFSFALAECGKKEIHALKSQHERKFFNIFQLLFIRLEPVEGWTKAFSQLDRILREFGCP